VRGLRKSCAPICEANDLRLLWGEIGACFVYTLSCRLTGGCELALCPGGEARNADLGEHLMGGAQLFPRLDASILSS